MRGWRLSAVRVALALGALAATLLAVELVLRLAGTCSPVVPKPLLLPGQGGLADPFTQPDEHLLYRGVPGARTYPWYRIEEHGWRTPPFAARKAPGSVRIVVTGDSTTFGLGVLADQHWPALLSRALNVLGEGDFATEVIDAAFVGYSTLQNRMQVEHELAALDADLVIVLVSGVNDTTRVRGRSDAELVASQQTLARRLSRLRVATLLGLSDTGWAVLPPQATDGSDEGRPRVTPDEAADNVRAMAERLSGGEGCSLVVGLFPPEPTHPESRAVAELMARVAGAALDRGVPLADVRPAVAAFAPFPLYSDSVHPTVRGHTVIAETVLRAILPRVPLSPARRAWCEEWLAARAGELPARAQALPGAGAPPAFLALLDLCSAGLDARLAAGDASLPEAVRDWDPLAGSRCRAHSAARLLLADGPVARRAEIDAHVRPGDPLLACFRDEAEFLAADGTTRDLARAAVLFGAVLGLPPLRVDMRVGEAERAPDRRTTEALLRAVLELDPDDADTRLRLALHLHGPKRRDDYLAQVNRLAAGRGPLADFGRGAAALQAGDLLAAESALRAAIAGAPALGCAHFLLADLLFRLDRLDEAANECALAAALIGWMGGLPEQLQRIETRRAEIAAR